MLYPIFMYLFTGTEKITVFRLEMDLSVTRLAHEDIYGMELKQVSSVICPLYV